MQHSKRAQYTNLVQEFSLSLSLFLFIFFIFLPDTVYDKMINLQIFLIHSQM